MPSESHTQRLTTVDETGRGTPASTWAGWARTFPAIELASLRDVVVVAPHPDDEVLGVGALMARLAARSARVRVVAVTDGEAAYPDSPTVSPGELASVRVGESERACRLLGIDPPLRLGIPDGAVAAHEHIVEERLTQLLRPGVTCLSTWPGDGHPDHEAVGRAASAACLRTGATPLSYPVWMWHWAAPADPAVPWDDAAVLELTDAEHELKRVAVDCFATQIRPLSAHPADAAVLPPFVIDRLLTRREMVFG